MPSSIYFKPEAVHKKETVASIALDMAGTNYENPIVTVDPPTTGTTATATAFSQGPVSSLTLDDGGSNYTVTPEVEITGTGSGATATAIFGVIKSVDVNHGGSGYTENFIVTFTGGGGSGAAGTAIVQNGRVAGIVVANGGSDFASAPFVDLSFGDGVGANATAIGTFGEVDSITLTAAGTGYNNDTIQVLFKKGNAVASAKVQGPVQSTITVTNGGSGYTSVPSVTITDDTGPGAGATATATIETILAGQDILDEPLVITSDELRPGGGGVIKLFFSVQTAADAPTLMSIFNNDVFKGNIPVPFVDSALFSDSSYYEVNIDVKGGDSLNFRPSVALDSIDTFRTFLILEN